MRGRGSLTGHALTQPGQPGLHEPRCAPPSHGPQVGYEHTKCRTHDDHLNGDIAHRESLVFEKQGRVLARPGPAKAAHGLHQRSRATGPERPLPLWQTNEFATIWQYPASSSLCREAATCAPLPVGREVVALLEALVATAEHQLGRDHPDIRDKQKLLRAWRRRSIPRWWRRNTSRHLAVGSKGGRQAMVLVQRPISEAGASVRPCGRR